MTCLFLQRSLNHKIFPVRLKFLIKVSQNSSYNGTLAEIKPHIMCPAAMLCVSRWGFWLVLMIRVGYNSLDSLGISPHLFMWMNYHLTMNFFHTKFVAQIGFQHGTFQLPSLHASSIPWMDLDLNVQKTRRYFWWWFHIQENKWKLKYKREKKILWAILEIIPFIHFYPLG